MNAELASRYQQIARRVAAVAGGAHKVTLIAVSKGQPVEHIEALYSLGHRDFGENYAQEFIEKAEKLASHGCTEIRWHFIGHLQTNKVKAVLPYVHAIHSVDSERLASEIARRWEQLHGDDTRRLPCFIEVNIDSEASKAGALPADVPPLVAAIAGAHPGLQLQGLMAIPAASHAGASFAALRDLELRCHPHTGGQLSMGMSDDFELAIPQGATHVRVGTALFGARRS